MFRSLRSTIPAALFLFAFAGCSTTGQERTASQVESIQQFRTSLDAGSKQIDATVSALEQITASSTGDLQPTYKKFGAELSKLDSDAAAAKARSEAMRARTKDHLQKWEEETRATITSPALQRISEEQRAKARERFEELRRSAEAGREAYTKLSSDLHDIQKILDLNLTPAGVAAVKPVVLQVRADAKVVQASIGEIVGKLDTVKKAFSAVSESAPVPASSPSQPATTPPSNP